MSIFQNSDKDSGLILLASIAFCTDMLDVSNVYNYIVKLNETFYVTNM